MTYNTRYELYEAAAAWMRVCEKAGVVANVKHLGTLFPIENIGFSDNPESYEFPLALLEGKEVWVSSELYHEKYGLVKALEFKNNNLYAKQTERSYPNCGALCNYSWNPPKPKTVMVTLPIAMAEYYATLQNQDVSTMREACKTALEGKCLTEK